MARIALVTCRVLPEPDPDQDLLLGALRGAGMEAHMLAWDDPDADPSVFDVCVLRSTWNYHRAPAAFLEWIDRAAASSRVVNPPAVVRWNVHKGYLRELERAGVPVIPTAWFARGAAADLRRTMEERGWNDVVVKPAVSAGSFGTERFARGTVESGQAFLEGVVAERDAMVQRYMRGVEEPGERAVVCIDGLLTHAVVKAPRFSGGVERVSGATPVYEGERAVAAHALSCVGGALLYARIDLVAGDDGAPVLSELELVEPSLFLLQHPPALARLVAAISRIVEEKPK
jgi:glutathione synthase/RimK-type ligase-like ATP-grasp enzyme